nr:MAG TPA: hypothetical protein [Caudoviricetes sp.]
MPPNSNHHRLMYFATIRNIVAESSRFETVLRLEPTQSFFLSK